RRPGRRPRAPRSRARRRRLPAPDVPASRSRRAGAEPGGWTRRSFVEQGLLPRLALSELELPEASKSQDRVERLVQPLAEQRQSRHEQNDREPWEETGPPDPGGGVRDGTRHVVAPFRPLGRLDAVAEKAQRGEEKDRVCS